MSSPGSLLLLPGSLRGTLPGLLQGLLAEAIAATPSRHPEVLAQLGPLISLLRTQKKMTSRGFARQVGITPVYLSRLEHGICIPRLNVLLRIAGVLEVPLHELLIVY